MCKSREIWVVGDSDLELSVEEDVRCLDLVGTPKTLYVLLLDAVLRAARQSLFNVSWFPVTNRGFLKRVNRAILDHG